MALPLAGIAANLLLGAAIAGVGLMFGGKDDKKSSTPTPSKPASTGNQLPPWINQNLVNSSNSASTQAAAQPVQNVAVTQAVRPASPQALAKPETVAEKAVTQAAEIQRLPVFTPTAPTLTTKSYSSQKRADVQKTKAGEQQLRNPLAIDKDATSSAIQSNLPSIGVSASGTSISSSVPGINRPVNGIKKGNSNAR